MSTRRVASRVLAADLLTPVGAYLRLVADPELAPDGADGASAPGGAGEPRHAFLLESIEGGAARGRYSVIGLAPDLIWRCRDGVASVGRRVGGTWRFEDEGAGALDSLRARIDANRMALPDGLPPMIGALVGYLGYDMARQMERLPRVGTDDLGLPEALLMRARLFAVFDNVRDELTLAAPYDVAEGEDGALALLDRAEARLAEGVPAAAPLPVAAAGGSPDWVSNCSRDDFIGIVERVRAYIAAGDAFQVVPSQRFSAPFGRAAIDLYRSLRRINPAPFLYVLELGDDRGGFSIVGSSPEILVRLRDGVVTIRPLAGTRRRGADRAEDAALERELLADPKERAEHLMLVDLGRNDVGRVCDVGSVRVTESFVVERFSHVMHISSNVEGTLAPGRDAVDALVAGFPAGTLSGAPKIRAMEIIEELEPTRRGVYGGCIGYFAVDGTMDTCIGLRTAVLKDGMMHVQAGCGVVADSVAEAEFEETRQKARALMRAAEAALA